MFTKDAPTAAYIKSCQGTKVGDAIDQAYADRIVAASLVNDGIEAYDAGRYRDTLDVYQSALKTPGGEQLRVLNGIGCDRAVSLRHRHRYRAQASASTVMR